MHRRIGARSTNLTLIEVGLLLTDGAFRAVCLKKRRMRTFSAALYCCSVAVKTTSRVIDVTRTQSGLGLPGD